MKKKVLLIFLTSISLSCVKKDGFLIKGHISGEIPKYIYLSYNNKKDSARVVENTFIFKGKVEKPTTGDLMIPTISSINEMFYIENQNINIKITNNRKRYKNIQLNLINIDTIYGGSLSLFKYKLEEFVKENQHKNDWNELLYGNLKKLISENPKNIYLGDYLSDVVKNGILEKHEIKKLYNKLDLEFQSSYSKKNIIEYINPLKKIIIGNKIFDFELPTDKESLINTTQYRGSFLLIHFWASWCKPCRVENRKLRKIYDKLKEKQLKILNVSSDTDRGKWKKAIKKDAILWDNVIDTVKSNSEILTKYNAVYSLPQTYLIDTKGIVILINPSINELESKLDSIHFNKDKS